jgi:hypothetical protein
MRVRCAVTTADIAACIAQLGVDLIEDGLTVATHKATQSLRPGQQDTIATDFPEGRMTKSTPFST